MNRRTTKENNGNLKTYHIVFPYYVFENWFELLSEENKERKKILKAPLEFDFFLKSLAEYFPYRQIEEILRILAEYKIIPYVLDYTTIWKRLQNVNNKQAMNMPRKKSNKLLKLTLVLDKGKNKIVSVQINIEDKNNVVSFTYSGA
ncbi:hypothetical protein [Sulfurisphaera javensis]